MRYVRFTVLTLLTGALLAACGGGGTGTPPANPATFTAAAVSSTSIKLDWSKVGGATGYALERKTGTGAYAQIATPAATATSYTDTGLAPSTDYSYRLKAKNAVGLSSGKEASAKTQAASSAGSFTLSLEPSSLSIAQGGVATVTVKVARAGGFSGAVAVTLASPPSGVSADALTIASGAASGTLTLHASSSATVGSSAVKVHGASGDVSADATLTLDVTAAAGGDDFTLTLNPATLALAPGGNQTVMVNLNRNGGFTGNVTLALEGAIVGNGADKISGSFTPNPASGGSSTLSIAVGTSVPPGDYSLTVRGTGGNTNRPVILKVTVTAPATVLLVDDDQSSNNQNPADPKAALSDSDTAMRKALDDLSVNYNVFVVPTRENGPSFDQLKGYQTVVWYTGDGADLSPNTATVSSTDELNLAAYLDQGNRKLVLFSGGYLRAYADRRYQAITNDFINNYIGATKGRFDFNQASFTASGVAGAVTAGLKLQVAGIQNSVNAYTSVFEPGTGTDTLLTIQADPANTGTTQTVAIGTGNKDAGAAMTSKVVFVGFPAENIVDISTNSKKTVVEKLLAY